MIYLSIIIPHFNSTNSLEYLIHTIPDSKEIEIIVVDDRSDEKYKEELVKLKEKNIHRNISFYSNEQGKKSAGSCRNIGLSHAKGDWLLFADDDDFFLEGFYEIISQYFNTINDVIFFTPTSIESQTRDVSDRHVPYKKIIDNYIQMNSYESELFLRYSFFVPWSKLIRTSFLKENKISFDEVIASNDIMFSTKVGHYMVNFEVTSKVIYCVTRNTGSLTVNISENVFDARLIAHIDYCNFLRANLKAKELEYFDLKGSGYIASVIKYRLGIKKMLSTYLLLRKSRIKVLDLRFLNPIYIFKKILYHYRVYNKNKKYFSR